MKKNRLEAFSDGVLAIIITVMVLEFKTPQDATLKGLWALLPTFLSYVLSFIYIGIYWSNHHHMLYACQKVNGVILWANLNLLFWLSLFPFATSWIGSSHFSSASVFLYGVILFCAGLSYWLLQTAIIRLEGPNSVLKKAIGSDLKGKSSPVIYLVGMAFAYLEPFVSLGLFVLAALIWLVPDRRVEKVIE